MQLLERLNQVGFERTRRAVAALGLSLFVFFFLIVSLNAPPGLAPAFVALSVCYGVAFMGVAAEWFWGRWFAIGLGWSGIMLAGASLFMVGWTPILAFYGGLHGLVVLLLMGAKMAERYDLQPAWRERYGMDEFGVARLRKTVTRASASLPSVIFWALGPKEPGQGMLVTALALTAGALAVVGLRGAVRARTWGLVALVASAAVMLPFAKMTAGGLGLAEATSLAPLTSWAVGPLVLGPGLAAAFLAFAVLPFAVPVARYLRKR